MDTKVTKKKIDSLRVLVCLKLMLMLSIQNKIITWFRKNKRPLPWRGGKSWYEIWISEVMLQQTQVDTVIPYYHRFIEKFKTIKELANASQEEILKIWEGLGYYSRARNLQKAAQMIVIQYNSQLPTNREELLKIPGFGPYTTNAVLSIAFNQPHGVMDGNVKRVLSRLFAIKEDIREIKTQHKIQNLIDSLLPLDIPGEFNEAIMELGATVCKPSSPLCCKCPISEDCLAYKNDIVNALPYKSVKPSIPSRWLLACIIFQNNHYLIARRPQHEMLGGLWEFPVLNVNKSKNKTEHALSAIREQFNLQTSYIKSWPVIKHTYTHFHLNLHSKLFQSSTREFRSEFYDAFQWLKIEDIKMLPLHKAMWKVIKKVEAELIIIPQ
jgi:A/G-specific adenine glycosylase